MVSFIKKFLASTEAPAERISQADSQTRIRIATCATLVEMAGADDEFTADERNKIISILGEKFSLSHEEADDLIEIAVEELEGSIDIYTFTKIIKRNYSEEDRIKVMETVWNVIFADGQLSQHEDSLVHKLSLLLGLSHSQLIDAKLKALGKR